VKEALTVTKEQKDAIAHYLSKGFSKKKISDLTGIPLGTIKSYCSRSNNGAGKQVCENCGKRIEQTPHKRKKRFCCDKCRLEWWNSHPELVSRTTETLVCGFCGRPFAAYRKGRRFCSKSCSSSARRTAE
jgi:hypothetical protein